MADDDNEPLEASDAAGNIHIGQSVRRAFEATASPYDRTASRLDGWLAGAPGVASRQVEQSLANSDTHRCSTSYHPSLPMLSPPTPFLHRAILIQRPSSVNRSPGPARDVRRGSVITLP